MTEAIIAALVTGVFSVIAVIITNTASNNKIQNQFEKNQAIFNTKLEDLTRKVEKHNQVADRMIVAEQKIKTLEDEINEIRHSKNP